jgi:hypothetical protein
MIKYRVEWEIELDAETPQEAAKLALKIHRDKDSLATMFFITDSQVPASTNGEWVDAIDAH